MIRTLFARYSAAARQKRAAFFRSLFPLNETMRILDLGSEGGDHIHSVLSGSAVKAENVYIADIDDALIQKGQRRYGYRPVLIPQEGALPFEDGFFDLVYCNSVIEHVTVNKEDVWKIRSGKRFREFSRLRQQAFSEEIARLGKGYFVQTPHRFFPIESHSWLPFLAYLPRRLMVFKLRITNRFWVKKTRPDWNLLTRAEMMRLFPDARVYTEKSFGLIKSLMAVRLIRDDN